MKAPNWCCLWQTSLGERTRIDRLFSRTGASPQATEVWRRRGPACGGAAEPTRHQPHAAASKQPYSEEHAGGYHFRMFSKISKETKKGRSAGDIMTEKAMRRQEAVIGEGERPRWQSTQGARWLRRRSLGWSPRPPSRLLLGVEKLVHPSFRFPRRAMCVVTFAQRDATLPRAPRKRSTPTGLHCYIARRQLPPAVTETYVNGRRRTEGALQAQCDLYRGAVHGMRRVWISRIIR